MSDIKFQKNCDFRRHQRFTYAESKIKQIFRAYIINFVVENDVNSFSVHLIRNHLEKPLNLLASPALVCFLKIKCIVYGIYPFPHFP